MTDGSDDLLDIVRGSGNARQNRIARPATLSI